MAVVPSFPPLRPGDSLVARIERLWHLKPTAYEISIGFPNENDDSLLDWHSRVMTRAETAKALRSARRNGLLIERKTTGYSISGALRHA